MVGKSFAISVKEKRLDLPTGARTITLRFRYLETDDDDGALVIPYPPDGQNGRTNFGFADLRGHPEEARRIAEAAGSSVFRDLLAQLATVGSRFFSLGCDLGGQPITRTEEGWGYTAGGYVQIATTDLHSVDALDLRRQKALAAALCRHLEKTVDYRAWDVEFVVTVIGAEALGGPDQVWSPVIHMHAFGANARAAGISAEALFAALADFLR